MEDLNDTTNNLASLMRMAIRLLRIATGFHRKLYCQLQGWSKLGLRSRPEMQEGWSKGDTIFGVIVHLGATNKHLDSQFVEPLMRWEKVLRYRLFVQRYNKW